MNIDLHGLTALVTGSSAGIGLGAATGLARAGAHVVITGRNAEGLHSAIEKIGAAVPDAELSSVACDLALAEGVETLTGTVPRVDILVNNLGMFDSKDFFDTGDDVWERFFHTNIMSGIRTSRAYMPEMMRRGWGRVVFVTSESGVQVPADAMPYAMTKTAVISLSRGLAKVGSGSGVTVNAVMPGPTMTEAVAGWVEAHARENEMPMDEAGRDFVTSFRPSSIIKRPASVEEVANMIVYACSKEASATTGGVLRVDGGVVDAILP